MTSDFARQAYGSFARLGPGSRVAGYLIEKQIGAGGMAVVFRARDEVLGRLAAVKVIAPSMADDEEFRARFLRESRAAAAVASLHIVPVYGAGEADGLLYIATRFVAGGDLAELARRSGGRLAPERVVSFVSQVASALDTAHAAGLVHRDVKPGNILVDAAPERPEHAYLADFGLSKATTQSSTSLTAAGQFVGTPDYSAPEQIMSVRVDGRADQYALGCVAFALLTGTPPFRRQETMATLFAHLQDPVPAVTGLRPELSPAVDDVIAAALAKSPESRYNTCRQFATALQEALVSFLCPSSPSGLRGVEPRPQRAPDPVGWPQSSKIGSQDSMPPLTADRSAAQKGVGRKITKTASGHTNSVPSPEPQPTGAGWPADGVQGASFAGTVDINPVVPPGRTGSSAAQAAGAPRPPSKPPSRASRHRTGLIAAGIVAVAGLAAGILTLASRPSPGLSAASAPPPATSPSAGPPAANATDQASTTTATGTINATLSVSGSVNSLAFGPGGTLATGDTNGTTYLWNTSSGKIAARLADPGSGSVSSVAFGPRDVLATGDDNGTTYLWNTAAGKITAIDLDGGRGGVDSVAFGPGGTLATGDGNGHIFKWDSTTNVLGDVLSDPGGLSVNSVAFGPGGILATGERNGSTYLWSKALATLTDPESEGVTSVAFGPGGTLATGDTNGSTYLWNTATGKITATLTSPETGSVNSVAFGPGSTLATGDTNGSTYLWHITYG